MAVRLGPKPAPVVALKRSPLGDLYVTDHPDDPFESLQQLRELYQSLHQAGFSAVRYDWRWLSIEPREGELDQRQLAHYGQVKSTMDKSGLNAPIIILSSPPKWALGRYRRGQKEVFFRAYQRYVEHVVEALRIAGGQRVHTVQIFNELNNRLYTKVEPADIAKLCGITRTAFRSYGEINLLATVLALPRRPLVQSVLPFLRKNRSMLESNFDSIGVDYYPGTWHWPTPLDLVRSYKEALKQGVKPGIQRLIVGNMGLLESIYAELAQWRTSYELAEVGWTSYGIFGGESAQAVCSALFMQQHQSLVTELAASGVKLPSCVGVYTARDEVLHGPLRLLAKDQRWGLYDTAIRPKHVIRAGIWKTLSSQTSTVTTRSSVASHESSSPV